MPESKPRVVVTGIAGNLGQRLLPMLADFSVIGVDLHAPAADAAIKFERMDLAEESSCGQMLQLLRDIRPAAVVHLAFVLDPVRTGILDLDRMWQVNVAGPARVMEAITEMNRNDDDGVRRFIYLSSVAAYGSDLPSPATEETPLAGHTLPYAIHKREADAVVQMRATSLRNCNVYILRPPIFAGASVDNYMVGAFRGTPNGSSPRATKMRERGKRLPCMLPTGKRYLEKRMQFIHVDDMARLIAHLVGDTNPEQQRLTVLNVAGRGEAMTFARCVQLAANKLVRLPGLWLCGAALQFLWDRGISSVPPEALPYMTGEYIMDTSKLRAFLGDRYEPVIQHTIEDAFRDTFSHAKA